MAKDIVIEELSVLIPGVDVQKIKKQQYAFEVTNFELIKVLVLLKNAGYSHLSVMTVVDWIKENEFELDYLVWSYEKKIQLIVKTRIDRKTAEFDTIKNLWPTAESYEREIFESFGINFRGNDNHKPFVLEDWKGIPPMRKDFDIDVYSRKKFEGRKYE